MPETYREKISRILRDHQGYTGDGQGGVGALPVGDRSTARKPIEKRDVREALLDFADVAESAADSAIEAALYDPSVRFKTVPDMRASNRAGKGAGTIWQAGGYRYEEVTTGEDLTNAAGVKLRAQPMLKKYVLSAFGNATNTTLVKALSRGNVLIDVDLTLTAEVDVPDGREIEVSKAATVSATGHSFFNPLGDFELDNYGVFSGDDDQAVVLARVAQTGKVMIRNTGWLQNVQMFNVDMNGKLYENIDTATDLIGPVRVENPQGICTTGTSGGPIVAFRYCDTAKCIGGYSSGYRHGGQAWGGDSDFSKDGATFADERKCKNVLYDGLTAVEVGSTLGFSGGGVWGSMVDGFRVTNCILRPNSGGGDVGIDFEGCFNCNASGNDVRDFKFGNFTTFFGCRDVIFDGNTSVQKMGQPTLRTFNSSLNADKQKNIQFSNNDCSAYDAGGATAYSTLDAGNGPVDGYKQFGNQLRNIVTTRKNTGAAGDTQLGPDNYTFDVAIAGAFDCIHAGNIKQGSLNIEANRVRTSVAIPTGSRLIHVESSDFNKRLPVHIKGNKENGQVAGQIFDGGIEVVETGGNAGVSAHVWLTDNTVDSITVTNSGSRDIKLVSVKDNYQTSGTALMGGIIVGGTSIGSSVTIANGSRHTFTAGATGAALGDHVEAVSFSASVAGFVMSACVKSANSVEVTLNNNAGFNLTVPVSDVTVLVRKAW